MLCSLYILYLDMKYNLVLLAVFASILITSPLFAQKEELHTINLKSPKQLHRFFSYQSNADVLISGHRGGMEAGYPENSIATFENTLRYTPAFYEIDPRLTKDSVIVLMHDATLDRTTTAKGKLADYAWNELQDIRLKDKDGNLTPHSIPTLAEVIEWARGKTILNLDIKDVPMEMTASLIKELNAEAFVMLTVHSPEQALYYLDKNVQSMFSAHIKTVEEFHKYDKADIPWKQVMAYIGSTVRPENQILYDLLHAKGVKCMISSASSYDKLDTKEARAEAYRSIVLNGADVLESDFPIEVSQAISSE